MATVSHKYSPNCLALQIPAAEGQWIYRFEVWNWSCLFWMSKSSWGRLLRIKSFNDRRKILRNCGKHFVNLIERKNGQRNVEKRLNGQHEMEKVQENLGGVFFAMFLGHCFFWTLAFTMIFPWNLMKSSFGEWTCDICFHVFFRKCWGIRWDVVYSIYLLQRTWCIWMFTMSKVDVQRGEGPGVWSMHGSMVWFLCRPGTWQNASSLYWVPWFFNISL